MRKSGCTPWPARLARSRFAPIAADLSTVRPWCKPDPRKEAEGEDTTQVDLAGDGQGSASDGCPYGSPAGSSESWRKKKAVRPQFCRRALPFLECSHSLGGEPTCEVALTLGRGDADHGPGTFWLEHLRIALPAIGPNLRLAACWAALFVINLLTDPW